MVNFQEFYRATNPNKALNIRHPEDKQYYIDFASVRGGEVIRLIKNKIILNGDNPSCTLFTGHIGCGKTTELFKLKDELEKLGFYVVYFASSEYLEITDVDIVDILLVIINAIVADLESNNIPLKSQGFRKLLEDVWDIFNSEVTGIKGKTPLGEFGFKSDGDKFSISFAIGEITTKAKNDSRLRQKMNMYLAPKKNELLTSINRELLAPAIASLKAQKKRNLVVIVDNLDRIDNTLKPFGKTQQEYLFSDQAESLNGLHCHLIYTMPLGLMFSSVYGMISQRFGDDAKVLPMVPVKRRDGTEHHEGMVQLRQMVLARAFPELKETERIAKITEIFASTDLLDSLCRVSGGHVRDLLKLLNAWIMEEMQFPLTKATLDRVITASRNAMKRGISQEEKDLLAKVKNDQNVSDETGYQTLIRSRYVFEYQDEEGSWYDVNPILE